MTELSNKDYKNILAFYKKPIPKTYRLLKQQAEKLLANKLCKCIKKIELQNEARSIGICTKTIINNKGFKRGNFTCKNKQSIDLTKISKSEKRNNSKRNNSKRKTKKNKRNSKTKKSKKLKIF